MWLTTSSATKPSWRVSRLPTEWALRRAGRGQIGGATTDVGHRSGSSKRWCARSRRAIVLIADNKEEKSSSSGSRRHRNHKKKHLAVLVSGGGSNFRKIQEAIDAGGIEGQVVVVISEKEACGGMEYARSKGIDTAKWEASGDVLGVLRQKGKSKGVGSDRVGSDRIGSDRIGTSWRERAFDGGVMRPTISELSCLVYFSPDECSQR